MSDQFWLKTKLPEKVQEEMDELASSKKLSAAKKEQLIEKVKKRYADMQLDPGEAIGIVSAQSIGEPGTQMSLAYDEKVLVKYKDNVRTVKIGEFIDSIIDTQTIKHEGKYEIYDISEKSDIEVLSIDNNEKLVWKNVNAISRHSNEEELLKIKLRSGREITSTGTHSFVIRTDNNIVPIAGKDLGLGDRIPVAKTLNFQNEISEIDISAFKSIRKKNLPDVLELDEQLGWIFGAYLAEGNATKSFVNISNNGAVFMQQIQNFSNEFGLTVNTYTHSRGFSNSTDIRINSTTLSNLLKGACGTGSYNKRIPNFAINANKQFLAGLLRAYFDGDGNVSVERKMIRTYSKSKELIEGIALLLNRFGIFSRKSTNKGGYTLAISHRYADIFLKEISLNISEKLNKLKELAKVADSEKQYNITEMYTGFSDVFYILADKLGYPKRLINNFTKKQKIGRFTLKKYIDIFSQLAKEQNADVQKELEILKRMYDSDVIWDEIVSMEYVKDEHNYLYDFSVPGLETFTTSEGIVTHNTMRTFHFVGVSALNVTLGLPRIIEILDARKEPKTPSMMIHLKSSHNRSRDAAESVANKITEVEVSKVVKEINLDLAGQTVILVLDSEELRKYSATPTQIYDRLVSQVKGTEITQDGSTRIIIKLGDTDIKKLYKLKEKVKGLIISGVKGITHTLPIVKEEDNKKEYVIQTFGSNLKDVFEIPEVDYTRTTTNNLHEIAKILGIEAARQAIVNELVFVLEESGMPVDIRHILLVADLMCASGQLLGITRHGVTSKKSSVLARASFEIPLTHLISASVIGETDKLTSVVENVMVNQPIPVGTGLPDLIVRMDKTKSTKKPTKQKDKEVKA